MGIFVVGSSLLKIVVESLLLNRCCGVLAIFVVEYLLWTLCYGLFVVESLSWNLCCGISVVE